MTARAASRSARLAVTVKRPAASDRAVDARDGHFDARNGPQEFIQHRAGHDDGRACDVGRRVGRQAAQPHGEDAVFARRDVKALRGAGHFGAVVQPLIGFGFGRKERVACPDITRRGDTLFAPEAQSYQWLHDGAEVPGATQRFYLPPNKDGVFTVRLRSLTAAPLDYTPGPTVVVTGAVLDEFLRPIATARK